MLCVPTSPSGPDIDCGRDGPGDKVSPSDIDDADIRDEAESPLVCPLGRADASSSGRLSDPSELPRTREPSWRTQPRAA